MGLLEKLGLAALVPAGVGAGSAGPKPPKGPDPDQPTRADERQVNVAKRLITALTPKYDEGIARAQKAIDAQPVPALKTLLEGEIAALRTSRGEIDAMDPISGAKRMSLVSSQAHTLAMRAEGMLKDGAEGAKQVEEWAAKPLDALKKKVATLTQPAKGLFEPRIPVLEARLAEARVKLDKADFDGVIRVAGPLMYACKNMTDAIDAFGTDYQPYVDYRDKVNAMLKRIESGGLLDADGTQRLNDLKAAVTRSEALGPIRGYKAALVALQEVVEKAMKLRESNDAYVDYQARRKPVEAALKALKAHKQATRIGSELKDLDDRLKEADKLAKRSDGGSLKALTGLAAITTRSTELRQLADKLEAAQASLPALKTKLAAGGVDKKKVEKVANMAIKLLVEENCSEDEAVKMAKDANGYADEGLAEHEAIVSSRVKNSLEKDGVAPAFAKTIGRNIRAGGTASADDAKTVAKGMTKMSPKAVEALNKAGIETTCCRGPVTDALPDLAGVHPRAWPDEMSWDSVPGVFSPDENKVIVGTIADGAGGRKIPASGEGDAKHGEQNLLLHESGHGFDEAGGGKKSKHKDFVAARKKDVAAGGMAAPGDAYFMTKAEGGRQKEDEGALSESFAESFMHHFDGGGHWPNLASFWSSNPWGV